MEYINILNNPSQSGVQAQTEKINFNKAITADDKSCFTLSGSKRILDFLRQQLGDETSMIIDFSATPSSIKNEQKLADFITVFDPNHIFTKELDKAYNHVYGTLKEKGLGLFYHPLFFNNPQLPLYQFSSYTQDNLIRNYDRNTKNNIFIKPEQWLTVQGEHTIKFKNKSFPISFDRYAQQTNVNLLINCQTRNSILLQFYNKHFLHEKYRTQLEKCCYLLSIPLIGYPGNEKNESVGYEGAGAIFVYFFSTDFFTDDFIRQVANNLWSLGLQITYYPIFQIAQEQFRAARKESIKSAKAAIMSRNMSHNLGSHVMSYLKTHLGSVKNILRDNVLSVLLESEDLSTLKNLHFQADELTLPFLVGLGRFISYLQERQDFIATVSTDYIPYFSTVNFKDFIYDELNSDKRYERHPDRTNLKPDNILLGNIARSEGLGRQTSPTAKSGAKLSNIVLKFGTTFDGSPVEKSDLSISTANPKDFYGENVDKAALDLDQMRKYEFSLPGGVVGRQAIFSIIENIIRNAAKHGNWRQQGKLELTIDIFTKEDVDNPIPNEYLKERLKNNDQADNKSLSLKEVLQKFYCGNIKSADDYFIITITDNLDYSSNPIKQLRKALHEDYVDKEGRMISTNKGIKEMRISAAWLRSISDDIKYCPFNESNDDLEGENSWPNNNWEKRPPVLYVRRSKDENEDANQIYHLQYVFCVFQPKKVAFVSSFFKAHKAFNGWYFLSPQKYLEFENKNFEFVIYDDETSDFHNKNLFKEVRCLSSQRFVNLSELDDSKKSIFMELKSEPDDKKDKLEEAYICLYKHLSERLTDERDKKDEKILIVDEKAEENNKNIKEQLASKIVFEINNQRNDIVYYRYLTHLEEKNEFRQYVINEDPEMDIYPFSEGISGDNSTDRLIRNELLTELWFFKHLYAMKQKIAIFDERIFSLVCGLDESDFANTATSYGSDLMSDIKRLTPIINDEFDKALLKLVDTREKFNDYMKNHNLSFPKYTDRDQVNALNHLGTTYFHKNLFVFSLIPSFDHSDLYNLYGFKTDPQNEQTFSLCVKYATIGWDQNQKRLLFTPYNEHSIEWKKFRTLSSLSIHQGLLDKMYSAFGIKKNDIQTKENLTKDFYEFFIKDSTKHVIEFNDVNGNKRYFLPGMTIHSGRSKPSEEDMPQRLPFIPYSAIEQAVLDCKYSIVELLNSSRYE